MAKALYAVYFIFGLGLMAMVVPFFSAVQSIEPDLFSCMKLEGQEQMKCVDGVTQRASALGKIGRAIADPN